MIRVLLVTTILCYAHFNAASQEVWYGGPYHLCTLPARTLDEASGIVASRKNSDVLWLHNDSGDEPRVYAITTRGRYLGSYTLGGAKAIDWEDMAYGPGPTGGEMYLYLADIGDNQAKRSSIVVYRVPEPLLPTKQGETITPKATIEAEAFTLTYPDGARDAEALIVDPRTQDWYVITKREKKGRIYRIPAPHVAGSSRKLEFIGELPFTLVTGADISSDGSQVLVKNYLYAWHWTRRGNESVAKMLLREPQKVNYMPEPQGEAICFTAKADGYYTTSERENGGDPAPVYFYPKATSAKDAASKHDAKLPSITIEPSADTPGIYLLRYVIPEVSRVEVTVHNAIMMKIIDVASEAGEAGIQEREIDLIDHPTGSYVVMIRLNNGTVVMAAIDHKQP